MPELTDKEKADQIAEQQKALVEQYKTAIGKSYKPNDDQSGRFLKVEAYLGVRQFADKTLWHTFRVNHFRPDGASNAISTPSCKSFLENHTELTS